MENQQKPKEIQVELNEQIAEGVYANFVIISHSDNESIFDFARLLPGATKAKIHSRIIMTPKNAKLFLNALSENIKKYEEKFGIIKILGDEKMPIGIRPDDSGKNTVN